MTRRLLPLLILLCGACAHSSVTRGFYGEDTKVAHKDCRTGELGWWSGPLQNCAWYPFERSQDN